MSKAQPPTSLPSSAADAKRWVNEVIRAMGPLQESELETRISKLAVSVHAHAEATDAKLQSTGKALHSSLPGLGEESQKLTQSCSALHSHLGVVQDRLTALEGQTLPCMRVLSHLNTVRAKVKECHDHLDKAQQWTRVQAQVEEGFANSSVLQISQGLSSLRESLGVLHLMQDFEARTEFVKSAQKRLDSLLMPRLLHALHVADVAECQSLLEVYRQTGQLAIAKKSYMECRQGPLFERWNSFQKGGLSEGQGTQPLTEWLPIFLDYLFSVLQQETAWVASVFDEESAKELPGKLVTCFLDDICASFRSRLQVAVGTTSFAINNVLSLFKVVTDFATRVLTSHPCAEEWEKQVIIGTIKPFEVFYAGYATLERTLVLDQLNMLAIDKAPNDPDTAVQVLTDSSRRVFMLAEDSIRRFFKFTGGANVNALIDTVGALFVEYSKQFTAALTTLCTPATTAPQVSKPVQPKENFLSSDSDDDDDFGLAVVGADEPDFNAVKAGLGLVPVIARLQAKLQQFEIDSARKLAQANAEFGSNPKQPIALYLKSNLPHLLVGLDDLCRKHAVDANHVIFADAKHALGRLLTTAKDATTNAILSHTITLLQTLPTMQELTQTSRGAALDENVPTFSNSPLPYITRIGQYLLMLPEQLDPYTTDPKAGGEAFGTKEWLVLVAARLLHELTTVLLKFEPKQRISARAQLQADTAYLKNIFSALGVDPRSEWEDVMGLIES